MIDKLAMDEMAWRAAQIEQERWRSLCADTVETVAVASMFAGPFFLVTTIWWYAFAAG